MAETTYFNEPDVQVTSSQVVAPWGEYKAEDIREVELQRELGVPKWVWYGTFALFGLAALFEIFHQITDDAPFAVAPTFSPLLIGAGVLINELILKPRQVFKVVMRGAFGRVIFDCGDNERYAHRLKIALQQVVKARENQSENT